MEKQVVSKRQKLDLEHKELFKNKLKLSQEINDLKQISFDKDELIKLDVGGTHQYTVKRELLCSVPNSKLAQFF